MVPGQGTFSYGTMFRIKTNGTQFLKLHDFGYTGDGSFPDGGLIELPDGTLMGITLLGGINNKGTIFKVNQDGTGYGKLYDFETATGSSPRYKLTMVATTFEQSIAFNPLPEKTYGDQPFTLSASASTGFAITFTSSNPAVATVTGNTVTITGGGECIITATQQGDGYYRAAHVNQKLVVKPADQIITFTPIETKTLGDATFSLSGTSSAGLTVQFTSASDKISISGNNVTPVRAGRVVVTAVQPGTNSFRAREASQTFCINPAKPIISVADLDSAEPILTSSSTSGNQWFRNGAAIAGANAASLKTDQVGIYTLKITADDCSSELSEQLTLLITGTGENASGKAITLYPNPATDEIMVDLSAVGNHVPVTVDVYDLNGRKTETRSATGGKLMVIDIRNYSRGNYLVKVTGQNKIISRQFIKD